MGKFEDEQQAAARSRADGEHVPGQSAHGVDAFCRHRRLHYHFHSRLSHVVGLVAVEHDRFLPVLRQQCGQPGDLFVHEPELPRGPA